MEDKTNVSKRVLYGLLLLLGCVTLLQVITILVVTGVFSGPVKDNLDTSAQAGQPGRTSVDGPAVISNPEAEPEPPSSSKPQVTITKALYDKDSTGNDIHKFTFQNQNRMSVEVLTYGGIIKSLRVPGKDGVKDIVQGYTSMADYESNAPYFGALIGRVANRIARGIFRVDGVTYRLNKNDGLNHLHGEHLGWDKDNDDIEDHVVTINANRYLEVYHTLVPTGRLIDVARSLFDFRRGRRLGDVIHNVTYDGIQDGYDHALCLNGPTGMKLAARVHHPRSGRVMEVYTNQPSVQFYTANMLNATGKHAYPRQSSFCLETQNYPDAVNHGHFPDSVLRHGSTYLHQCVYKFSRLT